LAVQHDLLVRAVGHAGRLELGEQVDEADGVSSWRRGRHIHGSSFSGRLPSMVTEGGMNRR
jgi:hypothetical protein